MAQFDRMVGYKCRKVVKAKAAYTSERCDRCGYTSADNRRTLREVRGMSCGHADHADPSAAANILAFGIGATARREVFGLPIPTTREIDTGVAA